MAEAFGLRHRVVIADIAPARGALGPFKHWSRLMRTTRAGFVLAKHRREPRRVCYIACEGHLGLIYTGILSIISRQFGYELFLHHHSFAYIDSRTRLMRLLLAIAGSVHHIFLCPNMRARFESAYGPLRRASVISNAAFVAPSAPSGSERSTPQVVLGHLSNLTVEKGLYVFLNVLRVAIRDGLDVRGVLAGPVALEKDRLAIEAACQELGGLLEYRGPLYDKAKEDFYEEVDVFVFPTSYVNEAQPTVIFEAMAAGCQIISYGRGCIEQQVESSGLIVPRGADFSAATLAWLSSRFASKATRNCIRFNYERIHDEAKRATRALIER